MLLQNLKEEWSPAEIASGSRKCKEEPWVDPLSLELSLEDHQAE